MASETESTPDVPWRVYLLECADGSYYCGVTNDLDARVAAHNAGKGAKYTRGRAPVEVVWQEIVGSRGAALRRELFVKALTRSRKEALVNANRVPRKA